MEKSLEIKEEKLKELIEDVNTVTQKHAFRIGKLEQQSGESMKAIIQLEKQGGERELAVVGIGTAADNRFLREEERLAVFLNTMQSSMIPVREADITEIRVRGRTTIMQFKSAGTSKMILRSWRNGPGSTSQIRMFPGTGKSQKNLTMVSWMMKVVLKEKGYEMHVNQSDGSGWILDEQIMELLWKDNRVQVLLKDGIAKEIKTHS